MLQISESEVFFRLRLDNPWWRSGVIERYFQDMPKRDYFVALEQLVASAARRAVVMLGPRRVGKTVLIQQLIDDLLQKQADPKTIAYLSLETPLYSGIGLEQFLHLIAKANETDISAWRYVFFDEVQYLKEWEVHLKSLVDSYPHIKFVATGSAAAALRLKSRESGAGRFTDFTLPSLTFREFLRFQESTRALSERVSQSEIDSNLTQTQLEQLNTALLDYLNFGGYPEAITSTEVRSNPQRFIKSDIIDKVLLRDLPSLYGIADTIELNRLFSMLAYNTGQELSLEKLAMSSGVSKPTIERYLSYLEAAFLIRRLPRVDVNGKTFKRLNFFKCYLTNPSMRSALFASVDADSPHIGALIETAVYAQLSHLPNADDFYYARWADGEVDFVQLSPATMKPIAAVEAKFSDRVAEKDWRDLDSLRSFMRRNEIETAVITSKTVQREIAIEEGRIYVTPIAPYLVWLGRNASRKRSQSMISALSQ